MSSLLRQALGLSVLVVAVYANATGGTFHYDDLHSLVDNPSLRAPVDWGRLLTDPTAFSVDPAKGMFRPLVLVSYAVQHAVHGYRPFGYLVVNLLLHLGCVLLFWRVAARLGPLPAPGPRSVPRWLGSEPVALVAAALFAVHPVASEPVNYVSARSETLAGLLLLAALWAQLRAGRQPRFLALSLPAFGAALLSKATAAALPLLVGLRAWEGRSTSVASAGSASGTLGAGASVPATLARGPARPGASPVGRSTTADGTTAAAPAWWRAALQAAPYALMVGGYVAILASRGLLPSDRAEPVRTWAAQLATQLKAVPYYLQSFGMPIHLSVDPAFAEGHWGAAVVWVAAGLVLSTLLLIRHAAAPWRWWLCWPWLVTLPASAVPLNVLVNEHRIYLAVAGLCVPLAALVWRRSAAVGLVLLIALTVQRNAEWSTERSLWTVAVERAPASARARVHLGNALRADGLGAAARRKFSEAVRLEPGNLPARTNLANTYYEEALSDTIATGGGAAALRAAAASYEAVLSIDPGQREALTNLGNLRRLTGDTAAAVRLYERAIELHPSHPDAYANLADLRLAAGDPAGAVPWLRDLVSLEPEVAAGHRRLGDALALAGDLEGAAAAYRRGCDLDPGDGAACYNGAEVLRVLGDAAQQAGEAGRARQLWVRALQGFRQVLATQGDYRQARQRVAHLRALVGAAGGGEGP